MSEHLESQRISGCVLGEQSDADRAHLALCAECRHQVDQFERALHGLRGSIHRWSEREFAAVRRPAFRPVVPPALTASCGIAVLLLLSLLGLRFPFQPRPTPEALFADSDAQLIDNVRIDMERPVPKGMEPLQALP